MFNTSALLEPPCNEWEVYELPEICQERIKEICADILRKGDRTKFQTFYDMLYEQIEPEVREHGRA